MRTAVYCDDCCGVAALALGVPAWRQAGFECGRGSQGLGKQPGHTSAKTTTFVAGRTCQSTAARAAAAAPVRKKDQRPPLAPVRPDVPADRLVKTRPSSLSGASPSPFPAEYEAFTNTGHLPSLFRGSSSLRRVDPWRAIASAMFLKPVDEAPRAGCANLPHFTSLSTTLFDGAGRIATRFAWRRCGGAQSLNRTSYNSARYGGQFCI